MSSNVIFFKFWLLATIKSYPFLSLCQKTDKEFLKVVPSTKSPSKTANLKQQTHLKNTNARNNKYYIKRRDSNQVSGELWIYILLFLCFISDKNEEHISVMWNIFHRNMREALGISAIGRIWIHTIKIFVKGCPPLTQKHRP